MTDASLNRRQRRMALALPLVTGLLLVSCDQRALPTAPTPPPPPTVQRSTGPIAFVSDRDGTARIYLANEDGSMVTPLVVGQDPAWSKDGRQIAFGTLQGGKSSDIRVIDVNGSGDRVIAGSGSAPTWSPDGRSLAFASWRDDSNLDVVNLDGSNRRSVFVGPLGSSNPTWSPDGRLILFQFSDGAWCTGLSTVNADGSDATQIGGPWDSCSFGIEPAFFYDAHGPAWSPDGSEIAFDSAAGIEVARADGAGRHLRVPGPAFAPDWTPDGRLIYMKGPRDGPKRIFISDGGTERQLIPNATAPARPTYSDWSAVWLR